MRWTILLPQQRYSTSGFCMMLGHVWTCFERCVGHYTHPKPLASLHRRRGLKFTVRSEISSTTDRTEGDEGQNLQNYTHNTHTPSFIGKSHRKRVLEPKNHVVYETESRGALFFVPPLYASTRTQHAFMYTHVYIHG